jgi:RimJ/RimL family protein N-acetyltransferase
MRILESKAIDLIEPFPLSQVKRLRGWLFCYKSLVTSDADPSEPAEVIARLETLLAAPHVRSWGIIDKFNSINSRHEAPLVGCLMFERVSPYNGYVHVATNRMAWGRHFADEAGQILIKDVFDSTPELLRLSAAIISKNYPARELCKRLGFEREGTFKNFILQNSNPMDVVHYGMTRERWNELCQWQASSQPSSELAEAPSEL